MEPVELNDVLEGVGKTKAQFLTDRTAYMQHILQLEDEEERIKDRQDALRDELQQIRGALAYVEMSIGEIDQKQAEIAKAAQEDQDAEDQAANAPVPEGDDEGTDN